MRVAKARNQAAENCKRVAPGLYRYRPSISYSNRKSYKVTAQDTNKALAIRRIAAHCLITIERPSASIGDVDASCAPLNPAAEH